MKVHYPVGEITIYKLDPCPFCTAIPILENLVVEAVARCNSCGARITRRHEAKSDTGVAEVITAWNRRPFQSSAGDPQ